MCIAILKPAKTRPITDEEFKSCFSNNKDGFGYAYVAKNPKTKNNFVNVKKFLDYNEFLKSYRKDEKIHVNTPFLIHFRMTSAGKNTLENCHPFSVNDDLAFIHNGTMSCLVDPKKDSSDTSNFNEYILKGLPDKWWDNNSILTLVEHMVGQGRVIFLHSDMSYLIINEEKGHWKDGMWFSNHDYHVYRRANNQLDSYYKWLQSDELSMGGNHFSAVKTQFIEVYTCGTRKTVYVYKNGTKKTFNYSEVDRHIKTIVYKNVPYNNSTKETKSIFGFQNKNEGDFVDSDLLTEDTTWMKEKTKFECDFCFNSFPLSERQKFSELGTVYDVCPNCYDDLQDCFASN